MFAKQVATHARPPSGPAQGSPVVLTGSRRAHPASCECMSSTTGIRRPWIRRTTPGSRPCRRVKWTMSGRHSSSTSSRARLDADASSGSPAGSSASAGSRNTGEPAGERAGRRFEPDAGSRPQVVTIATSSPPLVSSCERLATTRSSPCGYSSPRKCVPMRTRTTRSAGGACADPKRRGQSSCQPPSRPPGSSGRDELSAWLARSGRGSTARASVSDRVVARNPRLVSVVMGHQDVRKQAPAVLAARIRAHGGRTPTSRGFVQLSGRGLSETRAWILVANGARCIE